MKHKSFMIPRNGLLQVLDLSQLRETSGNGAGEVNESFGVI